MSTAAYHHDYPYRLRMAHPDLAELRLERRGRWLRFDPADAPGSEEITVLTGPSPTRVRATVAAVKAGKVPMLVAPDPLRLWLGAQGPVRDAAPELQAEGLRVELVPYTPAPAPRAPLFARRRPDVQAPSCDPHVVQVTFDDGARLLHLDLALHARTDEAWLDRVLARFGGPEWLFLGVPWGEGEAVERLVPRFGAKRVLVADLSNAERREQGLPTELVTPVRDRLVAGGTEAHVFATQASFRFE